MSLLTDIPIWQVDAFADRPFSGNPAAVCILERYPADEWMRSIAAEMNLSETAFMSPLEGNHVFQLRWFTPVAEVDLCGHATLASAHVLLEQQDVDVEQPIRFHTRSGELTCVRSDAGITLDFPTAPTSADVDPKVAERLLAALGISDGAVMISKYDLLVIVEDDNVVESLRPNFNALEGIDTRGVMVSAACGQRNVGRPRNVDFVSRFFAPRHGVNEDPVTGSAHCCLAPYWAQRLGKKTLVGYQASSRGGTVRCEVVGERVLLTGSAVTVLEGRLLREPL